MQHLLLQRQPEEMEPQEESPSNEAFEDEAFGEEEPVEAQKGAGKGSGCTRTILAEGSCEHLACNSSWSCCNPDSGANCPDKSRSESSSSCPSKRWTPLFTCDNNCETALEKGCDDNDHWMAVPGSQFKRSFCGQWYTICANGRKTTAYVRDRSETSKKYEVSPGVQLTLGVTVGQSFKGSVYRPGAKQDAIDRDRCCNG